MLEDVRLARVIIGWSSEKNGENIIHVLGVHMKPLGPSGLMRQLESLNIEVWDLFDCCNFEALDLLANFDVVGDTIFSTRDVLSKLMCLATSFHHSRRCSFLLLHFRHQTSL